MRAFTGQAFLIIGMILLTAAFGSSQTVPTPESVLGHKPGDDFYLASYDDARGYFRKIAETSNRVKLINVGKTTRGTDWEIAIISAPENLANLDHYKEISGRLADGRGLNDQTARAIAREGKVPMTNPDQRRRFQPALWESRRAPYHSRLREPDHRMPVPRRQRNRYPDVPDTARRSHKGPR